MLECRSRFIRLARWRWVCAAIVVMLLSACGSTVQSSGNGVGGPADGGTLARDGRGGVLADDGLSPDDSEAVVDATHESFAPDRGSPGETRTRHAGGAGGPASPPGAGSTPSTPAGATSGRGFTEDEVYVGYGTLDGATEAFRTFGVDVDFGDHEAQVNAIVDDINARGGVAGRKLVPVFFDFTAGATDPSGNSQAACSRWTEDRPVLAVINPVSLGNGEVPLAACLAQRQTPLVMVTFALRPASVYARYAPYLLAPNGVAMERLVPRWLQRAGANGYFDGWDAALGQPGAAPVKIGVLSNNSAAYGPEFTSVVRAALSQRSLPVTETYEFSGNTSTVGTEMNQAVLRFRSAGVTHVVPQNATLFSFFSRSAEPQGYRPRYAVSSSQLLHSTLAPERQRHGALGVGWLPALDVDGAKDPGDVSGAQTRCRKVMDDAGQDTSERGAFAVMVSACDGFGFLTAAIERGGLEAQAVPRWATAVESMAPASTFGIAFPRNRPDGASAVRDVSYDADCECWAYLSPTNHEM